MFPIGSLPAMPELQRHCAAFDRQWATEEGYRETSSDDRAGNLIAT